MYLDLRAFIDDLERRGQLVRVPAEVDPNQEVTIIQHRVIASGGPALLFENIKGSPYRLVSNLFGTNQRVALACGEDPLALGERARTASDSKPDRPRHCGCQHSAPGKTVSLRAEQPRCLRGELPGRMAGPGLRRAAQTGVGNGQAAHARARQGRLL